MAVQTRVITDTAQLRKIQTNLRLLMEKKRKRVRPTMVKVCALIKKESQLRTPIKTGNLRASHRTRVTGSGAKTTGSVYLLAEYALYVHEASRRKRFASKWKASKGSKLKNTSLMDKLGAFVSGRWRGRKYLERAITDNFSRIMKLIQSEMKKK